MENLQETIQNKVSFYRDDMITYWKDLVNYQAGSKEAELITALLQKVADRFTKEGFTATMLDTGCAIPMLRATLGDDRQGKPILFCGHADTVFPSGSYPDQPFRIEDGKVYGPGCADMKGGVVMLLYVIKILTDLGYKDHPFKVVLVGDEETTHVGSRADQMLAEEAKGCLCAFNMETGRMNHVLTVARKGCMDVWVKVHGKSGHVGNAYTTSANAIEAMAGIITKMRALTDLEKGRIVSTDVISGGVVSNAVPDFVASKRIAVSTTIRIWKNLKRPFEPFVSILTCRTQGRRWNFQQKCLFLKKTKEISTSLLSTTNLQRNLALSPLVLTIQAAVLTPRTLPRQESPSSIPWAPKGIMPIPCRNMPFLTASLPVQPCWSVPS